MKRIPRTITRRGLADGLGMVLLGVALLGSAAGGHAQGPVPEGPRERQPLVQQHTLEGVQATLEVERQSIGVADRLRLTLTVDAPAAMDVSLPAVGKTLGPFTVVRQTPLGPVPIAPQMRQWQRDYVLEPTHAGTLTLPALTVAFGTAKATRASKAQNASPDPPGDPKGFELSTQPVTITVTTVLPTDADVKAPQDIAPPVALPRRGLPRGLWIGGLALAACGLVAAIVYWHRQRRAALPASPQPAHLLALAALQRLQQQNLIGTQHVDAFYTQLSAIVRRYIEWRFGLRAPEQTTEEFLAIVLASGGLLTAHRDLLSHFLQHCDLVKFARHAPTPEDMQQTFDSARTFVEQTADDDVRVPAGVAGVEV